MTQKLIIEMAIYTDGDWNYAKRILQDYASKYFENDLYEYTMFDDEDSSRFRRVYDYNGSFQPVVNLIKQISDSIDGNKGYALYAKEFFKRALEEIPKISIGNPYYACMDSNTVMNLTIKIIETDAKQIAKIMYKE